jgi:diaminopimelate epimerase
VGADQVLVVERSETVDVDFRYRIFNADGGEVEQCGNGSRAFVRFVIDKHLTKKTSIRVETLSGVIEPRMNEDQSVTVDMGVPQLAPENVPFNTDKLSMQQQGGASLWPLDLPNKTVDVCVASMGNPHAVQLVDNVDDYPVEEDGPAIEKHPRFAKKVNAGFMEILSRNHINLRVFERGTGETLACGTGACAAVVTGIQRGLLDSPVRVSMRGGDLTVAWNGENSAVFLSGPAVSVYDGEITL